MAVNKNSSSNLMPAIAVVLSIVFAGVLIFKFDLKGDRAVRGFFVGRAIGTLIVFGILGVFLLLKYVLNIL